MDSVFRYHSLYTVLLGRRVDGWLVGKNVRHTTIDILTNIPFSSNFHYVHLEFVQTKRYREKFNLKLKFRIESKDKNKNTREEEERHIRHTAIDEVYFCQFY